MNKISYRFSLFRKTLNIKLNNKTTLISILTNTYYILLLFANLILADNNNFWGDEAYTANIVTRNGLGGILYGAATDVHPPLYYIIVKLAVSLLNQNYWLFRFVSIIPLIIILFYINKIIKDEMGLAGALIFSTVVALSPICLVYNVEVRMYSWAFLFMLCSYIALFNLLEFHSKKFYFYFTLFSVLASYTHYYCLVSLGICFIVLYFFSFFYKLIDKKLIIISFFIFFLSYLPWLIFLIRSFIKVSKDFWIGTIPTFSQCVKFLFFPGINKLCLLLLILLIIYYLLLNSKGFNFYTSKIFLAKAGKVTNLWEAYPPLNASIIWIIIGLIMIGGTIFLALSLSHLVRPLFVVRYIYPLSSVLWLIIGFIFSKIKFSKLLTLAFILYLLSAFIPSYISTYKHRANDERQLNNTLELLKDIKPDDLIISNNFHIPWTISSYYFPTTPSLLIQDSKRPPREKWTKWATKVPINLDKDKTYWIFIRPDLKMKQNILEQISKQGFQVEKLTSSGMLGKNKIIVYKAYRSS